MQLAPASVCTRSFLCMIMKRIVVSCRFECSGLALDRPSSIYDDRRAQPDGDKAVDLFFQVPEKTRQRRRAPAPHLAGRR